MTGYNLQLDFLLVEK